MRLIDADMLTNYIDSGKCGTDDGSLNKADMVKMIDRMPTAYAIPADWILGYADHSPSKYAIVRMVAVWNISEGERI